MSRNLFDNPELFWSQFEAGTSLATVVVDGFPLRRVALSAVPKGQWVRKPNLRTNLAMNTLSLRGTSPQLALPNSSS